MAAASVGTSHRAEKINQMCAQFNSDEITTFHAVKAAFDPMVC
ncbi:hypothetical protein ACNKHT_19455 [Shigella flexneri]